MVSVRRLGSVRSPKSERIYDRVQLTTLLASAAVIPLAFVPQLADCFALPKAAALLASVSCLAGAAALFRRDGSKLSVPLAWPLLAYFFFNALSLLASINKTISLFGASERYQGFVTIFAYLLSYCVAAIALRSQNQVHRLVQSICIGAVIVATYGVAQYYGLDPVSWETPTGRAFSTLGQSNVLAAYLSMVVPLIVWTLAQSRGMARDAWAVGLGVVLLCLVFTYSRAGWLALLVATGVFGVPRLRMVLRTVPRKHLSGWLLIVAFALAAVIAMPQPRSSLAYLGGRFVAAATLSDASSRGRLELLRSAFLAIGDSPLTGFGQDTFQLVFPRYRSATYAATEGINVTPTKTHNDLLDKAVTIGVAGAISYVILQVCFGGLAVHAVRAARERWRRQLLAALILAWTAYLVQSMFGFAEVATSWLFWTLMGATVAVAKLDDGSGDLQVDGRPDRVLARPFWQRGTDWVAGNKAARATLFGAVGVAGLAITAIALSAVVADWSYARGRELASQGECQEALARYREATTLNPVQPKYRTSLAQCLERLAAESDHSDSLLSAAEGEYRAIISASPSDAYALVGVARCEASGRGRNPASGLSAAKYAERAVASDPNNPVIRYGAGLVYRELGAGDEAETQLVAATKLAPYVDAYLALGSLYRDRGQYDLALDQYKSASLLRYDATIQAALGRAYWEAGYAEEAQASLRTALNLDPTLGEARSLYEKIAPVQR